MALSDAARRALLYWGDIQKATSARATTQVLYEALRAASEREGMGGTVPPLTAVNELRHLAASQRTAGENLRRAAATEQRTGMGQSITGVMIAADVRTRPAGVSATITQYIARFQATFTTPLGEQVQRSFSKVFTSGALPATVGDLITQLATVGQAYEFGAGGELTGVDLSGITEY